MRSGWTASFVLAALLRAVPGPASAGVPKVVLAEEFTSNY
jgi:hypothetical protein